MSDLTRGARYGNLAADFNVEEEPWMPQGACWHRPDLHHHFFPPSNSGKGVYDAALAICAGCPVRQECHEYADRTKSYVGVFGGLTPDARRKARNAAKRRRRTQAEAA